MKRLILLVTIILVMGTVTAFAGDVHVDVNVGVPGVAVPVYGPPHVVIEEPPLFVLPPTLGFYVAVGVPYDIVFIRPYYYLHRGGGWYRAPHYRGPWKTVHHKHIPHGLRKWDVRKVRHYRDREHSAYRSHGVHYRGKHFRPDGNWREHRKEYRREDHKGNARHWKADDRKRGERRNDGRHWQADNRKGGGRGNHDKHKGRD